MSEMDWLKKLLEGKGLSEELIKSIVEGVEKNYEGYVPSHRFNEVNEAKKQLESDLKDRDKQLADLKKAAEGNEELKKQIEQLQADNKKKDDEYQSKIKDMTITTAIKLAVAGEAHDPDLVAGLVDKSKIELDEEGNVKSGLEEQIKSLRESKAFLFIGKSGDQPPKFKGAKPAEGSDKPESGKNPWTKDHFNLTEQGKLIREDPEKARHLIKQAGGNPAIYGL